MGKKQSRPRMKSESDALESGEVNLEYTQPIEGQKTGTSGLRKKTRARYVIP